ncbi:MAG: large-conductance mechanosensitive channel protein MscL [Bacteroidota bacterium]
MFAEFKKFILRGNVLELAVAVIIGAAFGAIVTSFTNDVLMPVIGVAMGETDFTNYKYVLKAAKIGADGSILKPEVVIAYGKFVQKVVDFLIIGFVVFTIVRTYNKISKKKAAAPKPTPEDVVLLREIRDLLSMRKDA